MQHTHKVKCFAFCQTIGGKAQGFVLDIMGSGTAAGGALVNFHVINSHILQQMSTNSFRPKDT